MLNSAYQKALKNATVCWHQGQSRQPINFLPHHHHQRHDEDAGDDDYDDCAVVALNSLCCLSIVQNIYKKKKDAEQVEGREWEEEHETALSMSAIAGAGVLVALVARTQQLVVAQSGSHFTWKP